MRKAIIAVRSLHYFAESLGRSRSVVGLAFFPPTRKEAATVLRTVVIRR
jgi:hypothetical protein